MTMLSNMTRWILILIGFISLTACRAKVGAGETYLPSTSSPVALETATLAKTLTLVTVITPTQTSRPAQCTVVSQAAISTEPSPFPAVNTSDWVSGPETASVTIIEYSDFQ